jgi:cytochrome c2
MTLLNIELSPSELALLRTALTIFKDCKYCEDDSPRIHHEVIRKVLPKLKKVTSRKFGELNSFEQHIQFLYDEMEKNNEDRD